MTTSFEPSFWLRTLLALAIAATQLATGSEEDTDDSPAQSEAIPWAGIGAKATAGYSGEGLAISATPIGAEINCVFQKLPGEVVVSDKLISFIRPGGVRVPVNGTFQK
ncbi:MAG: hypothetical protein ABJQ29_09855 [Luteolibacter sp.]